MDLEREHAFISLESKKEVTVTGSTVAVTIERDGTRLTIKNEEVDGLVKALYEHTSGEHCSYCVKPLT